MDKEYLCIFHLKYKSLIWEIWNYWKTCL